MAIKSRARVKQFQYYDLILASFVAFLLISNIAAVKLIAFGSVITDGGALLFPLTYIFGDILTEVYGYRYTRRAIWAGFAAMALASATFFIVQNLPASSDWPNQAAFDTVLGFVPRIAAASLVAYLFGEFLNAFVLAKLKVRTKGQQLWARLIGSTVVGQLFDTIIFALIAFGGILRGNDMVRFIIIGWLFKVAVEVVMLPVTYRIIAFLKRHEGMDAYDKDTDFRPLQLAAQKA